MALLALVLSLLALAVALVALRRVRVAALAVPAEPSPGAPLPLDDVEWELQWIEPGVYFLANTSAKTAAFQVEVTSSLTPVTGGAPTTVTLREQRVNPGTWLEVRHPGVNRAMFEDLQQLRSSTALTDELRQRPDPLDETDQATLDAADEKVTELEDRVVFTLTYSVSWRSSGGAVRQEGALEQRLVPSPASF